MAQNSMPSATPRLFVMLALAAAVVVLYVAREVLIPFALAALLSFLLAPLVTRLERWKFGRIPAVVLVTGLVLLIISAVSYAVATQLLDLATSLPNYRQNIRTKMESLRGPSIFTKAAQGVTEIGTEVGVISPAAPKAPEPDLNSDPTDNPSKDPAPALVPSPSLPKKTSPPADPSPPPVPVLVEIHEQPPARLAQVRAMLDHLLGPLATTGIVVIFVVFILIQREDLRNRLVRLVGAGRLPVATRALDESALRISSYLRANLIINVTYGIPVWIALFFLGLPNAFLWGMLATLLRFVPYAGPWIAASMPIAVSLAVFPDWLRPLLVVGLFVVLELVSNNVLEPWIYGRRTGLSPLAVIVAAVFWAWLWGPIGLLMSAPLTVCLVVLGKHAPPLEFLDILLSDSPPLDTPTSLYQRLLAGDQDEVADIVEAKLQNTSLAEFFDSLLVPALHLAELDRHRGHVDPQQHAAILQGIEDLLTELRDVPNKLPAEKSNGSSPAPAASAPAEIAPPPRLSSTPQVLCLPAHDDADQLVAQMLADLLHRQKISAQVLAFPLPTAEIYEQIAQAAPALICISSLPPQAIMPARTFAQRLRTRHPDIPLLVGLWTAQEEIQRAAMRLKQVGAERICTTLTAAVAHAVELVKNPRSAADTDPTKP